jgi:copper transport protein
LLVRAGAVLAVVSTAVAFASYSATIGSGRLGDLLDTGAWGTAIDTRTGHMLVVRLVALVILVLLSIGWAASRTGWWLATAAAASIVAAATFPGAGHGGAVSPDRAVGRVGALHTAGGLVWIGGLLVLATCRLRAERTFSRISAVAIPIVVVTGTIQTLELVDDLADLTATAWGNVLLVKIAVVVVALSVAGVSHWLVVHANGASLRRTVLTEGVLGLGIISLAAGLVALPPTVSAESRVSTRRSQKQV